MNLESGFRYWAVLSHKKPTEPDLINGFFSHFHGGSESLASFISGFHPAFNGSANGFLLPKPNLFQARTPGSYQRSRRRSSWGGRTQTSAFSRTWSCLPSSPGSPCTSSLWGWRGSTSPRCGPTTPHASAGQTPPSWWAGSGSSVEPGHTEKEDSTSVLKNLICSKMTYSKPW